jgi:hypothetical protein
MCARGFSSLLTIAKSRGQTSTIEDFTVKNSEQDAQGLPSPLRSRRYAVSHGFTSTCDQDTFMI